MYNMESIILTNPRNYEFSFHRLFWWLDYKWSDPRRFHRSLVLLSVDHIRDLILSSRFIALAPCCVWLWIASRILLVLVFESLSGIVAPSQSMTWFSYAIWSVMADMRFSEVEAVPLALVNLVSFRVFLMLLHAGANQTTSFSHTSVQRQFPHAVTVLCRTVTMCWLFFHLLSSCSSTSGTSGRLQSCVSVPPWFLHSDYVNWYPVTANQWLGCCLIDT